MNMRATDMDICKSITVIAAIVSALISLNTARAEEVKPEAKEIEPATENIPSAEDCVKDMPRVVKPMEDYTIIAPNTANIDTSPTFSGSRLKYSYSANAKQQNIVKIDKDKGVVTVIAEKKDNFNIAVTATNACGIAVTKFNVKIDEET